MNRARLFPPAARRSRAPSPAGSSTTDWIVAISSLLTAVGTVCAVVVALWQTRRQTRLNVVVDCRLTGTQLPDGQIVHLIALRATNNGGRAVKLVDAYLRTNGGHKLVAPAVTLSDPLPALLIEGDSVQISWETTRIEEAREREGFDRCLHAFFLDSLGREHRAPYPA